MTDESQLFPEPPVEVTEFRDMTEAKIAALCLSRSAERLKPNERRFCFKITKTTKRPWKRDRERLALIAQRIEWRTTTTTPTEERP